MQIVASGLESKELGFKISRGNVQRALMDYKLPDGSGLDVAERIRSKGGAAQIILMSGYDPSTITSRAEKLCISDYLEKPFSREIICKGSEEGDRLTVIRRPSSI
jgi:DNA-binding response OmpR family regulator